MPTAFLRGRTVSFSARLAVIETRIQQACQLSGRSRDAVRLVAVSKTRTLPELEAALASGVVDLGENYAQELRDKAGALGDVARWHYIGSLQRNKVKYVAPVTHLFHAFSDIRLADEFAKRRETPMPVLIAVNTGGEASKSGVPVEEALGLAQQVDQHPGVELKGLMTIPPFQADPADVAPYFKTLADLAAEGRRQGLPLTELSMGMSHDFEVAIAHGATLVRVGTALFGPRE
jgi:pyridoxal phosphate enzyme (YggS family)